MKTERQQDQDVAERLRRENLERANATKDNEYDDHAATVAELRAEVERLRKSNELYSFAMNTAGIDELKRRADAAERQVGELEAEVARQASSRKIAEDRATELELKEKMLASGWLDEANAGYLTGDALIDCATTNRQSVFFQCANALTGADPT